MCHSHQPSQRSSVNSLLSLRRIRRITLAVFNKKMTIFTLHSSEAQGADHVGLPLVSVASWQSRANKMTRPGGCSGPHGHG